MKSLASTNFVNSYQLITCATFFTRSSLFTIQKFKKMKRTGEDAGVRNGTVSVPKDTVGQERPEEEETRENEDGHNKKQKKEDIITNGDGAVVKGLVKCVQGLEASVGSAFQNLTNSLSKSVNMMMNMNSMMEHYVMRSLQGTLEMRFDSQENAVKVTRLELRNDCNFPVMDIKVIVSSVLKKQQQEKEKILHEYTLDDGLDGGANVVLKQSITFDPSNVEMVSMTLSFPSPGTGQILQSNCKQVPILVTHLCPFTKRQGEPMVDAATCVDVSASKFREYFALGLLTGIEQGSSYHGKINDKVEVTVYIKNVVNEDQITLAIVGTEESMVQRMVLELK